MAAAVVKRFAETVSCFAFNADKSKLALCPNNTEIHIYSKKGAEWVEEVVLTEVGVAGGAAVWVATFCSTRAGRVVPMPRGECAHHALHVSGALAHRRGRARTSGFFSLASGIELRARDALWPWRVVANNAHPETAH